MGLVAILHKRNSGKEHKHKGDMSKPSCLILSTVVSQTFFIIVMSMYIFAQLKSMLFFPSKNWEINIFYEILSQT